jgi:hypothetical protein
VLLLVPQVLLFGGMVVMLAVHPNAFTSAVQSTRALVVNGALLAAWLLLSLVVVPRVIGNATWDAAILSTIAVAAVVVLVVPTLRDTKVVEEFPRPSGDSIGRASISARRRARRRASRSSSSRPFDAAMRCCYPFGRRSTMSDQPVSARVVTCVR